jgi:cobalt/nickel transport system permease protein
MTTDRPVRRTTWLFIVGGLLVALGIAFFVSPYASNAPDGLNKVAADTGLSGNEQPNANADGPLAGYEVKGVGGNVGTGLAGVIGVAVVLGVGMICFGLLRRRGGRIGAAHAPEPAEAQRR